MSWWQHLATIQHMMYYSKIIHWACGHLWICELCHRCQWHLYPASVRKWFSVSSSCPLWYATLLLYSCCPVPWLSFGMTPTEAKPNTTTNPSLPTITHTQSNNYAKVLLDHTTLEWHCKTLFLWAQWWMNITRWWYFMNHAAGVQSTTLQLGLSWQLCKWRRKSVKFFMNRFITLAKECPLIRVWRQVSLHQTAKVGSTAECRLNSTQYSQSGLPIWTDGVIRLLWKDGTNLAFRWTYNLCMRLWMMEVSCIRGEAAD